MKQVSKFLSLVLRHRPDLIGIELSEQGWVHVDTLLSAMEESGKPISLQQLQQVVRDNDKQRFAFSSDGTRIRANQGHSVDVDLGYENAQPPEILYHGTPTQFVDMIDEQGLRKMQRHHVHLHQSKDLARTVGQRRGKAVVLTVRSGEMAENGFEFFVTPNCVWLTDHVPREYIDRPSVF